MMRHRTLAACLLALPLVALSLPSFAQMDDRPPGGFSDDNGGGGGDGNGGIDGGVVAPSDSSDPAGLSVRVNRLEGRIREMTGQIEELQNDNRKLVDQLQKFQADVDSRFGSGGGGRKHVEVAPAPDVVVGDTGAVTPKPPRSHDDSFDPDTAPMGTPGQPKALGSVSSATPDGSGAPMDLSGGKLRADGNADTLAPTLRLPSTSTPKSASVEPVTPGSVLTPGGTVLADVNPNSPRAEFDAALGYYKDKQYDSAEKGFSSFIEKNPKSRLAADATYYLAATFAQRGRSREAAEQYLKISTDYSSSPRAPDAMLHLGMSLKALGAKEQACATYSEVTRKYPNAPPYVKTGVERETKRAQC